MDLEWVLDSVLTLPSGRRLKIHSESDLADAAAEAQAADEAYMTEDLGGWTGGSTWAAGEVLARLLMTLPWAERVRGARVIDLGCGTGLAGVVAAALGAERVSLTDRVLAVAEHNLRANFSAEERERYTASRLSWGDDAAIAALVAEETGGAGFDLILTADTIYAGSPEALLAETVAELAAPEATVLLAAGSIDEGDVSARAGAYVCMGHIRLFRPRF